MSAPKQLVLGSQFEARWPTFDFDETFQPLADSQVALFL